MMRFLKTVVLIPILLSMLVLASPGQSPSPTQPVATPTPAATATLTPAEIESLPKELKIAKEYSDKITGAFATLNQTAIEVFIFLFGGNVLAVFFQRRSETKVLRKEIDARQDKLVADFTKAVTDLKAEYENKLVEHGRLTLSNVDQLAKSVSGELGMLNHRLAFEEMDRLKNSGVYTDALITMSACVAIANKMGDVRLVQADLVVFQKLLDDVSQQVLSAAAYQQIRYNLEDLPPQVSATVRRVREKLEKLPISGVDDLPDEIKPL